MRKPVSLAPAGLSLKETPQAAPAHTNGGADPVSARATSPSSEHQLSRDSQALSTAAQVSEASVEAPVASLAADISQSFLDYWMRQADSLWAHGVTLSQATSLSEVVEAQGQFMRAQVELARAQSAAWSSLVNQSTGLSPLDKLPAFSVWAPWQTTLCKPGG